MLEVLKTLLGNLQQAPEPRSAEAPGEPAAYELAYKEATRALEQQAASLEGLRTRAGLLLSASALVAGLLAPAALPSPSAQWLPVLGGGLFLVATVMLAFILLPIRKWHGVTGTKKLLTDYIESERPATMSELHRSLAWFMEGDWDRNEDKLVLRNRLLVIAAVLVTAETTFWLIAIIK